MASLDQGKQVETIQSYAQTQRSVSSCLPYFKTGVRHEEMVVSLVLSMLVLSHHTYTIVLVNIGFSIGKTQWLKHIYDGVDGEVLNCAVSRRC